MTLDATARTLARHRGVDHVDTLDLLGACLAHHSTLDEQLHAAGFGGYSQLRTWVPEYPPRREARFPQREHEAPAHNLGRFAMRLLHGFLGKTIRSWIGQRRRAAASSEREDFTAEANAVWELATELRHGDVRPEDLLEALSVGPGTHRWYVGTDRRLLAAIARSTAGRLRIADRIVLGLDMPARLIRRGASALWRKRRWSVGVVVGRLLWSTIAVFWLIIRLVLGAAGWLAAAGILLCSLPFALVIRQGVATATRTRIRTLNPLLRLGGSVEVTAPARASRVTSAVLLPRALNFMVGVAGLVPFAYAGVATGRRPAPHIISRPELLSREINGFPEGPFLLVIESQRTYGLLGGSFFLAMLGLLFLSVPTAREADLSWVHLRHGVGNRPWLARLMWPLRTTSTLFESVERLFFWGVGPVYAAAGLVPLITGYVLASVLSRLVL